MWVGVQPLTNPLTYCGGPGQGGWCATQVNADANGNVQTTVALANVDLHCPPDIKADATDLTTNIGSNEVGATATCTPQPNIQIDNVTYPSTGTGTGTEQVTISGSGFTPSGLVWVGVNPTTTPLTYCGGPGQGGWCATQVNADPSGNVHVTVNLANVFSGCPPNIRADATDLTTNIGSNEVTNSPGPCIT